MLRTWGLALDLRWRLGRRGDPDAPSAADWLLEVEALDRGRSLPGNAKNKVWVSPGRTSELNALWRCGETTQPVIGRKCASKNAQQHKDYDCQVLSPSPMLSPADYGVRCRYKVN